MSAKPCACISLISAPAANAFSDPVSTRQCWLSSASYVAKAVISSLSTSLLRALSACGRFNVTSVTAPRCSTRIVLYSLILSLRERLPLFARRQRGEEDFEHLVGDLLGSRRVPLRIAGLVDQQRAHALAEIVSADHPTCERVFGAHLVGEGRALRA